MSTRKYTLIYTPPTEKFCQECLFVRSNLLAQWSIGIWDNLFLLGSELMPLTDKIYYRIKPFIPRHIQIILRQRFIISKRSKNMTRWPIDENAGRLPESWRGWPDRKRFSLILTHDVDTARGQNRCRRIVEIEEKFGFRSSFNFVPERYNVNTEIINFIKNNDFEIGVHGLYHDGKLYHSKDIFQSRVKKINEYLKKWGAVGFRSPVMQYNLEWIHLLNIEYDSSTYDTAIFEIQSKGVGRIFPFWVKQKANQSGFVELPYTLPQDFYLFVLMKEKNINIWKKKLDWIAENGGMALINTHPDYMHFGVSRKKIDEYPVKYYAEFLQYIKEKYKNQYWHVLPKDMAEFWSQAL